MMEIENENDKMRVGIYTQKSVEATATGDGLAPQGDKSPVAEEDNNQENAAQELHDEYGSEDYDSDNESFDPDNPNDEEGGKDGKSRKPRRKLYQYRKRRYEALKIEFKKLNYTDEQISAMGDALEYARKKRHDQNNIKRYCQRNNVDPETARRQWLERKEREIAKYKAEKAARETTRSDPLDRREDDRSRERLPRKRSRSPRRSGSERCNQSNERVENKLSQTNTGRYTHDNSLVFISPGIRRGDPDPLSSYENMQQGNSNKCDDEFAEFRKNLGLPVFNRSTSPAKKFKSTPDPRYPIEVQIYNKANSLGTFNEQQQQALFQTLHMTLEDAHNPTIGVGQCTFRKRILHIHSNQETLEWLENRMGRFERAVPDAEPVFSWDKVSFCYKKASINLTNYRLTNDEFLKIVKKQNRLPTELWKVYHKDVQEHRQRLLVGIDPESYEKIKEKNGYIYFFMGRLAVEFPS